MTINLCDRGMPGVKYGSFEKTIPWKMMVQDFTMENQGIAWSYTMENEGIGWSYTVEEVGICDQKAIIVI